MSSKTIYGVIALLALTIISGGVVLLQKSKTPVDKAGLPNGLICLKGGDLSQEIVESGCKPFIWEIEKIFSEAFFKEKYLLYIPLK